MSLRSLRGVWSCIYGGLVDIVSLSNVCFFFYGYGDHLDLHSFPTRRSSDLDVYMECYDPIADEGGFGVDGSSHLVTRSEEHTSELQSLRHLVCRLLLEKKKTGSKTIWSVYAK